MILTKRQDGSFAFRFDDGEMYTIAHDILDGTRRTLISYEGRFLGILEYTTMQFRQFSYEKIGLESVQLPIDTPVKVEITDCVSLSREDFEHITEEPE